MNTTRPEPGHLRFCLSRFVTGVAVVSCVKTVHDERAASDSSNALPSTGALTYVVVKVGHRWQIALAQTTPIL